MLDLLHLKKGERRALKGEGGKERVAYSPLY